MKIAIHEHDGGFGEYWIKYCLDNNIEYKIVDCYNTNIIDDLKDCDVLMWHHNHANPKDLLFAKELLCSLEISGKAVYPDIKTTWHFNDKLGQKYLLEAMNLPLVPTYVFFSRKEALRWISEAVFPLVFKLRSGAGSRNVRLIKSKGHARRVIRKAFSRGFRPYNTIGGIKENIRQYRLSKTSFIEVVKSFLHIIYPVQLEKSQGREKGYVYFQKFIPDCNHDIRVQLVGDKMWAMIRPVRKNDFRASGSGKIITGPEKIPQEVLKLSLEVAKKLELQSVAIDFLPADHKYYITEISYAFGIGPEDMEVGY